MNDILGILPEVQSARWLGLNWNSMMVIGFIGQAFWFLRFFLQWIASEKKGESVIPVSFWYCSIVGALCLLTYSTLERNPVFILAYLPSVGIYVRNLQLVYRKRARERTAAGSTPPSVP